MSDRAEFEAWAVTKFGAFAFAKNEDGTYEAIDTRLCWLDWQAQEARYRHVVEAAEQAKDGAYLERNQVVAALAATVLAGGGVAGTARTAIEGWSEDWHGCVYIELPTGQASWHYHDSQAYLFAFLPPYAGKWDGHTTPEKYERLRALLGEKG